MDPLSLIVAALVAGSAAAANAAVHEATVDAYRRLKQLILQRFRGDHEKEAALERFERQPASSTEPLAQALETSGVHEDETAVREARRVLETLDPAGAAAGKYSLKVGGDVQGLVQGDHNTVTMDFGVPRKEG
jgi:hypothetical protein